jgi:hypothetical protein
MVCVSNLTISGDPDVKLATTIPPANNGVVYPVTMTENGGISVRNVSLTWERRAERERSRTWTFGRRKLPGKICLPLPGRLRAQPIRGDHECTEPGVRACMVKLTSR